ncbi:MAG: hypothetical protein SF066_15210 [Thermoanaerobaculia bacterium]|nr:hypothetical protein [Thermoanaerobaculia bacterium]
MIDSRLGSLGSLLQRAEHGAQPFDRLEELIDRCEVVLGQEVDPALELGTRNDGIRHGSKSIARKTISDESPEEVAQGA